MISTDELDALHRRIAELEILVGQQAKALDSIDQQNERLKRLPEALALCESDLLAIQGKRIQSMAAILDRVPHDHDYKLDPQHECCPACAWAKLKEGK